MGKLHVRNFLCPPLQNRVKLFMPPPHPFKERKRFCTSPPFNMALPQNILYPPLPSAWLKLCPPPQLFVEVKLHVTPLPFCSPPVISDQSLSWLMYYSSPNFNGKLLTTIVKFCVSPYRICTFIPGEMWDLQ